jgi:hypothetical protein
MSEIENKIAEIYKGLHCDSVPKGWCHDDEPIEGVHHCANCEECSIKCLAALIAADRAGLVEALTKLTIIVASYLEDSGGCDHSVGICACSDIQALEDAEKLCGICTCTTICDCENPPPDDWDGESGTWHISMECPIHNTNPRPNLDCPKHGKARTR